MAPDVQSYHIGYLTIAPNTNDFHFHWPLPNTLGSYVESNFDLHYSRPSYHEYPIQSSCIQFMPHNMSMKVKTTSIPSEKIIMDHSETILPISPPEREK
jgi:hypothetical protein